MAQFKVGDRVQITNFGGVHEGDLGLVIRVDNSDYQIRFADGEELWYFDGELALAPVPANDEKVELPPEVAEAARKFIIGLADTLSGKSKICLVCGEAVERYEQIGRCVYADPCGHRQYQGRVPKN